MTPGILILGGPTASGKTELALKLAQRFDAEIVGADSRQIYRGMPVGTAAPTGEQRARVAHHLVAFLEPAQRYSAARYVASALDALDAIERRGRRAIVAGGTGFYIRALCGDVTLSPAHDPALRERLATKARLHPPEMLHEWLRVRDPGRAAAIAPGDSYRVVRALEIALSAGEAMAPHSSLRASERSFVKVWLDAPVDILESRIAARTNRMLEEGFIEEAEAFGGVAVAAPALGYPLALAYLRGHMTRVELRERLVRDTRRYAKRQRSWFRHEPGALAVAAPGPQAAFAAIERVARERLGWA